MERHRHCRSGVQRIDRALGPGVAESSIVDFGPYIEAHYTNWQRPSLRVNAALMGSMLPLCLIVHATGLIAQACGGPSRRPIELDPRARWVLVIMRIAPVAPPVRYESP
jgi:hypothetical protein